MDKDGTNLLSSFYLLENFDSADRKQIVVR